MPRLTYCRRAARARRGRRAAFRVSGTSPSSVALAVVRARCACRRRRPRRRAARRCRAGALVGIELAGLDQLLDLGDRDPPGHRAERVEVARRRVEDEVAVRSPAATHEREVRDDASSSTYSRPSNSRVSFCGERDRDRAVGGRSARAGRPRRPACRRRPGCRTPGCRAARAQPLGQRALRHELDLELAAQVLARELLVLADVGAGHAADPLARRAACPGPSRRRRSCSRRSRGRSRPARAARRSGSTGCRRGRSRRRRASRRRDVGDRVARRSDDLVHTSQPSATAGWVRPARLRLAGSGRRGDRAGDPEFVVHELPGQCNPGRLRRLRRARGAGHVRGRAAAVVRHRAAAARRVRADRERRDRNRHLAAAAQRDPAARSTSTSPASSTR